MCGETPRPLAQNWQCSNQAPRDAGSTPMLAPPQKPRDAHAQQRSSHLGLQRGKGGHGMSGRASLCTMRVCGSCRGRLSEHQRLVCGTRRHTFFLVSFLAGLTALAFFSAAGFFFSATALGGMIYGRRAEGEEGGRGWVGGSLAPRVEQHATPRVPELDQRVPTAPSATLRARCVRYWRDGAIEKFQTRAGGLPASSRAGGGGGWLECKAMYTPRRDPRPGFERPGFKHPSLAPAPRSGCPPRRGAAPQVPRGCSAGAWQGAR
jgi:hypothetical protein